MRTLRSGSCRTRRTEAGAGPPRRRDRSAAGTNRILRPTVGGRTDRADCDSARRSATHLDGQKCSSLCSGVAAEIAAPPPDNPRRQHHPAVASPFDADRDAARRRRTQRELVRRNATEERVDRAGFVLARAGLRSNFRSSGAGSRVTHEQGAEKKTGSNVLTTCRSRTTPQRRASCRSVPQPVGRAKSRAARAHSWFVLLRRLREYQPAGRCLADHESGLGAQVSLGVGNT